MSTPGVPPWGCPWHGKVQGGVLQLPNGESISWPQPNGTASGTRQDHAGYTFRQKLPGVAEILRTPEELAADLADGREWRNTFILAGTDTGSTIGSLGEMHLHSKRVGGWIYADPNGKRWLVKGSGTYAFSQGGTLNIPLQFRRFGDLGAPGQSVSRTVSITSVAMGQLTPSVVWSSFSAKVEDISPAGDKAIVMLYGGNKDPVGFLLLTLSLTPGVDLVTTLSVLKTRAATLGTATVSNGVTAQNLLAYHDLTASTEDHRGAYPDCGYVDTVYTPTAYVRAPTGSEASNVTVASGQNRLTISDRVMAMWFDSLGTPQPLTLSSVQTYTVDAPTPFNQVSGVVRYRTPYNATAGSCVQGIGSFIGYMSYEMSQSITESAVQTATLSYGGQSATVEYRHERSVSQVAHYTGVSSASIVIPPIVSTGTQAGGRTVTVDGGVVMTGSEAGSSSSFRAGPNVGLAPTWSLLQSNMPQLTGVTISSGNPVDWVPAIKRWANNLIGWRTRIVAAGSTAYFSIASALSPLGLCAPEDESSAAVYGSLNPITGDSYFPSATPVSWT